MVEQSAGRGDEDVDAAAERVLLRAHSDAADRSRPPVTGVWIARRSSSSTICAASSRVGVSDERARGAARLVDQLMEDREQKRRRLAAAGHGAREHVAPLERGRYGVGLEWASAERSRAL